MYLFFFWLSTPEAAVQRVRIRVREGGHNIPEDVIRRRYELGLRYFFSLYKPAVDNWTLVDNTQRLGEVIAQGVPGEILVEKEEIRHQLITKCHD